MNMQLVRCYLTRKTSPFCRYAFIKLLRQLAPGQRAKYALPSTRMKKETRRELKLFPSERLDSWRAWHASGHPSISSTPSLEL